MEGTNMSAADIAAVTRPNMYGYGDGFGFGGGNSLWGFLLIALLFGGGFGFGANRSNAATTDELSAGFNFSGVNNSLKDLMLGQANINQNLGNAICSSTYELGSKIDNCLKKFLLATRKVFTKYAVGSLA